MIEFTTDEERVIREAQAQAEMAKIRFEETMKTVQAQMDAARTQMIRGVSSLEQTINTVFSLRGLNPAAYSVTVEDGKPIQIVPVSLPQEQAPVAQAPASEPSPTPTPQPTNGQKLPRGARRRS